MKHQNYINPPLNFELPIQGGLMKFEARSSQSNSQAELFIKFENNQQQKNQLKKQPITTKNDKNLQNRRQTIDQYNNTNFFNESQAQAYSQKQRRSRQVRNKSEKRLNKSLRQSIQSEKKGSINTPSRLMKLLFNEVSQESPFHEMNIQEYQSDESNSRNNEMQTFRSQRFSQNKIEIPIINIDNLQQQRFNQKYEIYQDEIASQRVTGHFSNGSYYPQKNQLNRTLSNEKLQYLKSSPRIESKQNNLGFHPDLKQNYDFQFNQKNQFQTIKKRAGQTTALMQRYLEIYGEPSDNEDSSFQEINQSQNLVRNSSNLFLKTQQSHEDLSKTYTAWPQKFQPRENITTKQKEFKNVNYSQTILNNYLRNDSSERVLNIKSDDDVIVNFKSNETQLSVKKFKPQTFSAQKVLPKVFKNPDETLLLKLNPNLIKTFEKGSLSELKHRFKFNPQQKDVIVPYNYQANKSYKQTKLVQKFVDFSSKLMNKKNTFFVKELTETLKELHSKINEKKQFMLKQLVLFYCIKIQKNYRAYRSRKYYINFYKKLKLIGRRSHKGNFGVQFLQALALGWKVRQLFKLKEVKSKISLIKEHQNINYRDILDRQSVSRNLEIYTCKFISYLEQISRNSLWIMQKRNNQSQLTTKNLTPKNKQKKTFGFNSDRKPIQQSGYVQIVSSNKFKPNFTSKEYQMIAHSNYLKRVSYKPGLTVKSNRSDSGQRKAKPIQQIELKQDNTQSKRELITLSAIMPVKPQVQQSVIYKPSIRSKSNGSNSSAKPVQQPVLKQDYKKKSSQEEKDCTSASTTNLNFQSYQRKQSGSKFENPYILLKTQGDKLTRNSANIFSNKFSLSDLQSNNNKSREFEIKSSTTSKIEINLKVQNNKGDNLFVYQNEDICLKKKEKNIVCVSDIPKNLNSAEQSQLFENFKTMANGVQFTSEMQDDGTTIHLIFEDSEHAILTAIKIDGIYNKSSQLKAKVLQFNQQSVNLFELSNLPDNIQSDQLLNILSNYGDVAQISLNQKYNSALIIMQTQKDYDQVMASLKKPGSLKLQGKNIEINSKAKQQIQQQQQVLEIDNLPKDMNDEEVDELFDHLNKILDGTGFTLDVLKSADGQTSQAIIIIPQTIDRCIIQNKIKTHLLSVYNQQVDTRMADFQSIEIAGLVILKQNLQIKLQELGGLLLSLSEEGIAISRFPTHEMAVDAMNKIKDKQATFLGKNTSANPILAPVNTLNLKQNQSQKKINKLVPNSEMNLSNIVLIKNLPKDLSDEKVDNLFQLLENLFDRSQIELEIMNSSESQTADAIIKFQNYQLANAAVQKINQNNYILGNFVKATQIQFDSLVLYNSPSSFTKQDLINSLNKIIPIPPLDNKFIIDKFQENQGDQIIIKFVNQEKALKALSTINNLLKIKGRKIIAFPIIKEDQPYFDDYNLFQTPLNKSIRVNQNKLSVIPERSIEQTEQNDFPTVPVNSPLIESKVGGNSFIIHEEWDLENILNGPILDHDLNLDLDLPNYHKINESYKKIEITPFQETTFGQSEQKIMLSQSKPESKFGSPMTETNFGSPMPEIQLRKLHESFSDPKQLSDLFISDWKTPSDQFRRSPIVDFYNKPFKVNLLKMDEDQSLKSHRDSDDSKIEFQIELKDKKKTDSNQDVCINMFEENQQTFREQKPQPLEKYFMKKESSLDIAVKKRLDSSNNKPRLMDENEIKSVIQKVLQKQKDLNKKLVKLEQKTPKISKFSRQSQPKQKRKVDSLYSNPTASSLQREKLTTSWKYKFDY